MFVAIAAAGLVVLGATPAGATATAAVVPAAPTAAPVPPLAMVRVGENPANPANPLCGVAATAISVDAGGNLVEGSYEEINEMGCSLNQDAPNTIASGFGNVTQLFAEPGAWNSSTKTIFTIDTAGDLTAYQLTWGSSGQTLSGGTVIGEGWNGFTHVTYAGNGVFYAVDADGTLFWYRDLDVAGRTADWADGGVGAVIGSGWQNFPLVFASGGAIYASTDDGSLLWYGYSDPTSDSGTWADNSGAVVDDGWDTVVAATANAGDAAGHVLIHSVNQDGDIHFYDHTAADTGAATWSPVSGVAVHAGLAS